MGKLFTRLLHIFVMDDENGDTLLQRLNLAVNVFTLEVIDKCLRGSTVGESANFYHAFASCQAL